MAANIFKGISNYTPLIHTQLDTDSPGNETLFQGIGYGIEMALELIGGTNITGTVTSITETVLTDSSKSWTADEHIDRTLLITSGLAVGNYYTIDDNAATTLTLTGDTLVSDGVAVNDDYKLFYDWTNASGHDHDGKNTSLVNLSGIMSLPIMAQDATALQETLVSNWTNITGTHYYIRVPENATTLHMSARFNSVSNTPQIRFQINSNNSNATSGTNSYAWYTDCSEYDCSSFTAGDYELRIQMTCDPGSNTVNLQGYFFWWE